MKMKVYDVLERSMEYESMDGWMGMENWD